MVGAIIHAARTSDPSRFMWRYVKPYLVTLLGGPAPPSLDRAIALLSPCLSPCVPWHPWDEITIARWGAAVSEALYSEEVGRSVVDTLLQLAGVDNLRPHIPTGVWAWLKYQPSLPPVCQGRDWGTDRDVVCRVRQLGDLNILKSYLLLVWSEWDALNDSGFAEMQLSIAEDLGGIGMQYHREDLIKRLNHVLGEVDRGLDHFKQHKSWIKEDDIRMRGDQYRKLREVLLEVDQRAMKHLVGMYQVDPFQRPYTNSYGHVQNPIRPSPVLYLFRVHDFASEAFDVISICTPYLSLVVSFP
jgi:hypothetical protein